MSEYENMKLRFAIYDEPNNKTRIVTSAEFEGFKETAQDSDISIHFETSECLLITLTIY